MSQHQVVYLIVESGQNGNKRVNWRVAGSAYECRDGSFNMKLDMHPGLTFNIRYPKSNGERQDAEKSDVSQEVPDKPTPIKPDENIPF